MAISLPNTAVSRRGPPIAPISALRGCVARSRWRNCFGLSRETVSRWSTATLIIGLEARHGTGRQDRLPGTYPYRTTGKPHSYNNPRRKSPEEVGIASRYQPAGRRRVDPQGCRSVTCGPSSNCLEQSGYTPKRAAPSCPGAGPRGGPPFGEIPAYPAMESRPP